ncbi:MAG: cytochrome c [Terracidiphilus sp.]|jgi:mono/diheme cytochrome c family protein
MVDRFWALGMHRFSRATCFAIFAFAIKSPCAIAQATPDAETGAGLYTANCAICHAEDGSGTPFGIRLHVKDLNTKEVQEKSTVELAQSIRSGKDNMPAFGKRLHDEQIQKLVDYLKRKKPTVH